MEAGQITCLQKGLYAIDEDGVRSFLVEGDESCALIDSGFGKIDLMAALRSLTDKPIEFYLTHADPDHMGGVSLFPRVTLCQTERERFMERCPDYKGELRFVADGDLVEVAPYRFRVLHIPGHTPGSIALWEQDKRLLISGDTVQLGAVFLFGPGRDLAQYVASLERLLALSAGFDAVYPAHGPVPIDPAALDELLEGARRLQKGELPPVDPPMPLPCKLYAYGHARFLAPAPKEEVRS